MKRSVILLLVAVSFVSLLAFPTQGVQQNQSVISSYGMIRKSDMILIFEADFETGTFEREDVETFTWPDGPPNQIVEISDAFAHSGNYSAKCSGITTPNGMKARVCAGTREGVGKLPIVGSILEGYAEFWLYIKEWDGSSLSLLDFRCHVPADPYPTDHFIGTFWIWGASAYLRTDFPDFDTNIYADSLNWLGLMNEWHRIKFGFKIGFDGFYKVWLDGNLILEWYGDNSKLVNGWGVRSGYDTPAADRVFAGLTARGSDGGYCEIYVDDFMVTGK